MKTLLIIAALFIPVFSAKSQDEGMEEFIDKLLSTMSLDEKIGQLNLNAGGSFVTGSKVNEKALEKVRSGRVGAFLNDFSLQSVKAAQEIAVRESPHHIPLLFGMDVIHGFKTIFPIPLALSCTWDMELIENTARIAATEATANGISWTYSPMVDIARDPRWGRIAEGSGEDPWLGSQIAAAMVRGYQGEDLSLKNTMMACVKHFALYGAGEAGRDYNTVDMSRQTMYNDFLPPYKAAVDAGAGSVMTSFNVVDRIPATGNRWLLTTLLRDEWGFDGFVVTDYTATNEMIKHGMGDLQAVSALALKAGTDMDMVGEGFLTTLKKSLDEGIITIKDIDLACRRVLEAKYKLGLFEDPFRYMDEERSKKLVFTDEHRKAALNAAERSIVLLKNDNRLLPLKKSGTIAVVGPLAESKADLLGTWSMGGDPEKVVSVLEGIRNVAADAKIIFARGSEMTDNPMMLKLANPLAPASAKTTALTKEPSQMTGEAVDAARKSDVIIAVLGESSAWSGEAASMTDISLQKVQQDLLKALVATGKPVVLVLVNGRPMTLAWEKENVNAIVEAWSGGTEAGNAVARVIFGDYNPSGKLTTTFPLNVGQVPLYYNHLNTGRPMVEKEKFTSKYIDSPNNPAFPFGFGLSYTTFEYGDLKTDRLKVSGDGTVNVSVIVSNTGKYDGEEVVQLYINDPVASVSRPVRELRDFKKVFIKAGNSAEVSFQVTTDHLKFYNYDLKYVWEPGEFNIMIGGNSSDVKTAKILWEK